MKVRSGIIIINPVSKDYKEVFIDRSVIEDIKKFAEEDCDARMVKMCQGILKAIDSRPDDKYVAYRKVYAFCVS